MKKKLAALTAIVFCLAIKSNAQTNNGGFYIKGGVNFSNITKSANGSINNANTLTSFNAGIMADIPLAAPLSLQTGLTLTGKGSKTDYYLNSDNHSDNFVKTRFNPMYLQVPADLVIKVPISPASKIYFGAGPYAAIGVGGKYKTETSVGGVTTTTEENIKFDKDNPLTSNEEGARFNTLKRFDYGLNGVAGVQLDRFMIGVGYDLGLAKINSNGTDTRNDKNKYRVLSLNLGIKL